MSLATDANISKLQQMFPTVDGDVIAILLNDCRNNGTCNQLCVASLLQSCSRAVMVCACVYMPPPSQLRNVSISCWK